MPGVVKSLVGEVRAHMARRAVALAAEDRRPACASVESAARSPLTKRSNGELPDRIDRGKLASARDSIVGDMPTRADASASGRSISVGSSIGLRTCASSVVDAAVPEKRSAPATIDQRRRVAPAQAAEDTGRHRFRRSRRRVRGRGTRCRRSIRRATGGGSLNNCRPRSTFVGRDGLSSGTGM